MHVDIEPKMQEQIKTMCEEYFEISFVNVKSYLDTVSDSLPIRDYYSKTTYYRMFIAEMFPEYDKAVYIDSDTIVLGDMAELYHKDLKDCYVGAAHEQVMVQTEVYGDYAEHVLGIDRNRYFNAGLLLLNCKAFRENKILEQFVTLLDEYTFKLLHYIMVSKPWHYEDCRFGEYFGQYAKETFVYEEILQVLEREGRFDEDVEEDPPTKELLPEDIDYLRTKLRSKIKSRFAYAIARKYVNGLISDRKLIIKEIKGIENYANLDSGAIITCNHFNAMDSFAMQLTYEASGQNHRNFYRIIREGNYTSFPGFYGILMRNCNTFPLSSNKDTMKKFMTSVDQVLQDGHFMLIYPEQSMWWNYKKPKPLKKGGFTFAVRNNVPVLPCFITMEDSDVVDDDGFFVQEYTIHVAPPIYPKEGKSKAENIRNMMQQNFDVWQKIYEETYGIPLQYADKVI